MDDSGLSPTGHGALDLIDAGMAVFPLFPRSKVPWTQRGLNDWDTDKDNIRDFWRNHPTANVGVTCGAPSHGLVAIDLDTHGDSNGMETLRSWEVEHGELPETVTVITGSGGRHLLYRCGREVRNSANEAVGVDVRGDGGFIVAPPSIHPNGEAYEWSISPEDMDVATANGQVYEFIDFVRPSRERHEGERFELPESIDGNRNDTLFRYAASLRSRGLSEPEILQLVTVANQTRCKPQLGDAEVRKLVGSSTRYEQGDSLKGRGQKVDPNALKSVYDRPETPADRLKDETVEKIQNILLSLSEVRQGIKRNKFDSRLYLLNVCIPGAVFKAPHVLDAGESVKLKTVLERDYGVRNKQKFEDALLSFGVTEGQQFDPMADVLKALPLCRYEDPENADKGQPLVSYSSDGGETWSEPTAGVAGTLMCKYLGANPSFYLLEAERLMFRQLVARANFPGCKADVMMVLVGKQGTGKSTFVSQLALDPKFFLEGFSDFNVEDLKRISGKLVVEIPELDGFNGRDKNRIKSIITQTTDTYRESYAKTPVEHPRTALFFGTTNDGAFLNDVTGGRRYLPIECRAESQHPSPGLFDGSCAADVRKAWAETVALLKLWGEERFKRSLVLPPNVAQEADSVRDRYTSENQTVASVNSYLDGLGEEVNRVNVKRVMLNGMGYSEFQFSNAPRFVTDMVTNALDAREDWVRMRGRQRVGNYGSTRAWTRRSLME